MSAFVLAASIIVGSINLEVPKEYRHSPDQPVVVTYHENIWEMPDACNMPPELTVYACYLPTTKEIQILNPCYFPEAKNKNSYAYLVCHENAHFNGWKH